MDALELAWVTTVHKAQGGESHAVLMCLAPSHRPLLSRRLFYTGKVHRLAADGSD
jgi:ATP-dependent exoDNAse (exonuclease V) alpha subunit